MNRRTLLLLLAGLSIGAALGIALFFGFGVRFGQPQASVSAGEDLSRYYAPEVGAHAPEFTLESLGPQPVSLADLHGKVVLLNFWATWCGPCRLEMPLFQDRHEQWSDRLTIVGVNFDEPKTAVQAFADELGLTFPLVLDPGGRVQNLYRVRGYPTSIFLDENGVVQIVHIGIMAESQLDGYLQQLGVFD